MSRRDPSKPASARKSVTGAPARAERGGSKARRSPGSQGAPVASRASEPLGSRKLALRASLLAALEQSLVAARAAHGAAVEGATHAEARPENDKDTRGLEQSYLARGHAQRVAELEDAVAAVAGMQVREHPDGAPISAGALVTVSEHGERRRLWIAPYGGGLTLVDGDGPVTVLTPSSPLGRALLGKQVDDECELGSGDKARTLEIEAVE